MKKLLLLTLGAVLLFASCSSDDSSSGGKGSKKEGFRLNYRIEGISSLESRATIPAEPGEEAVNSLHLLFFENSSGGTGQFIDYYEVPAADLPGATTGSITVQFPSGSQLDNSTPYIILAIANGDTFVREGMAVWLTTLAGNTENDIIQSAYASVTGIQDNAEEWSTYIPIDQSDLLMSTRIAKAADQQTVEVNLTRGVVRFDVLNSATGFTLETVSVWNAFPQTSIWENALTDYVSPTRIERFYGLFTNANNEIRGGLYSFQNYVASPQQDDKNTTCLILGIRPDGGNRTYYRVNIHPESKAQTLRRNNVYTVNVQRVRDEGANSEKDAFNSKDFLLDINVNDWVKDENGSIQYDGENVLAVPTTNIVFTPAAETRSFDIFTLGEGTLQISGQFLPEGFSVSLVGKALSISVTASQVTKNGYVELRFGNLRATVNISQTGSTEQYLTLSQYTIDEFGYQAGVGMLNPIRVTSSGPWTATIYNGAWFTFQSGSSVVTRTGVSGDTFTISTFEANNGATTRNSFVHFTLVDHPDVHRTIVLGQQGVGGLTLDPQITQINFDPAGTALGNNAFTVQVAAGNEWEVYMATNASHFTATPDNNGSGAGAAANTTVTVTAAPNLTGGTVSGTLRFRLRSAPSVYKDVTLTQSNHNLSLNPPTVQVLPSSGGSHTITVTSSGPWTAALAVQNGTAYFGTTPGTTTATGVSGGTFTVTFPQVANINDLPTAEVTVTVDGTTISRTLSMSQNRLQGTPVVVQSYDARYHSLSPGVPDNIDMIFYRFRATISDARLYGPTGKVYTSQPLSFTTGITPQAGATIYNYNWTDFANATNRSNQSNRVNTWHNTTPNSYQMVSIFGGSNGTAYAQTHLRRISSSYTTAITQYGSSARRRASERPTSSTFNANVWDYIMNGPCGRVVNPTAMSFYTTDATNSAITQYPATTIPLLYVTPSSGTRHVQLAIDPTLRLLIIGDHELFSYYSTTNFAEGCDERIFLENLIAFMVNAAQYGEAFLKDFR